MNRIFTLFIVAAISVFCAAQPPDTLFTCHNGFTIAINKSLPPQYQAIPEIPDSLGTFFWDFGDGFYSYEISPVHTYQVSGEYIISFFYTSPDSCTSYETQTLIATGFDKCSASWVAYPQSVIIEPPFPWTDSTVSPSTGMYAFQDLSKGNIISWRWKFGDGTTSDEQNPVHEYNEPGLYTVCLEILTSDSCSSTFCGDIYVESAAMCNLTGTVKDYSGLDGCGLLIELDNGTVLEPVEIVPNCVIYDGERVQLSYTELKDRVSTCMAGIIARIDCITEIRKDSCNAKFSWYSLPWISSVPPIYQFDLADPDQSIAEVTWDFGDGTVTNEFTPWHRFPNDGNYTVCLTVKSWFGCEATSCETSYFDGYDPAPELCDGYIRLLTDIVLNGQSCNGSATAALVDDAGNNLEVAGFFWSTGETGPVIYDLCPGSFYSVVVTDTSGCAVSGSFSFGGSVSYPDSVIGYWNYEQSDRDFIFNLPVYSDSIYCLWDFGDGETAEGSSVNHTYNEDINYTVRVKVMDAAGNILYDHNILISSGEPLGIRENQTEVLKVYPVPATDWLYIDRDGKKEIDRIEISNGTGQLMMVEKNNIRNNNNITLRVTDLPGGLYIGRIIYKHGLTRSFKFVK
jgi:PKD repeat protein